MSLDWFTTVPGLLITGGVLLLVIALIIFIVTSIKDKNKSEVKEDVAVAPSVPETPAMPEVEVPVANLETPASFGEVVAETPVMENVPTTDFVEQTPAMDAFQAAPEMPVSNVDVNSVVQEETTPAEAVYTAPVEVPSFEQNTESVLPEAPVVENTTFANVEIPQVETPAVETPSVELPSVEEKTEVPTVEENKEEVPAVEEPQIYGGTAPVAPTFEQPKVEPQIYGGANPLENTQSVPISDIANGSTNVETPAVENATENTNM